MNASDKPLVSVIVVNWNGERVLPDCLQSLLKQTHAPLEVIVVDNHSTDRSVELIRRSFEAGVRLLENPSNLGFAGGNNAGIRLARGRYIALLNNDAAADCHWIAEMLKAMESDSRIGMCACKILSYEEAEVLDSAGGLLIYKDALSRGRGRLQRDEGQYDVLEEVLLPSGCACLYRRAMLDEIGLFDPDFFAYSDDTDLGLRGRLAGWRCVYAPTAVAFHRYSASAGRYSPLKAYLAERNRIWVAVKNFPLPLLLLNPFYTAWRLLLHAAALLAGRGVSGKYVEQHSFGSLVRALLKAYFSAIVGLPGMWKKRKSIQKNRKVTRSEIYNWLRIFRISPQELAFKE